MELKEYLNKILNNGVELSTSGTTGNPKLFFQDPGKLKFANLAAVDSQEITASSRIYTICKMKHAGGLLAQTLPGFSVGAEIVVEDFNAYRFTKEITKYTHSHITPGHADAIMKTRGFGQLDLTGIWITCGSDPVTWNIVEAFVERGATFMANWGMTEVGPCAVNTVFRSVEDIENKRNTAPYGLTIMGDRFYCDYKIENNVMHIKGDISIFGDTWYNTHDLVEEHDNTLYYMGRE